jgi:repressor LexA
MTSDEPRPLTETQSRVLAWVIENIVAYSPTVREIQAGLGYKSPHAVTVHLDALEKKGRIRRVANKSRNIEVLQCPKN